MHAVDFFTPRKYASLVRRMPRLAVACKSVFSGRLRRIPTEWITNEFAFSFAPEGWNYFRALVAEYEADPGIAVENTTFFRFFQHERVRSVRYLNDVLFLHDPDKRDRGFQFYLGTYPWGDHVGGGPWGYYFDQSAGKKTRDLYGYRRNLWHRPGDTYPVHIEWKKTTELYSALKSGYQPLIAGDLPEVTLLVRRDGAIRALRYNGQHRFSVLSHLGHKTILALIPSIRSINESLLSWSSFSPLPKIVDRREVIVRDSEVEDWPYVKRGLCAPADALAIFHAFFDLNGRERIASLGLPSVY